MNGQFSATKRRIVYVLPSGTEQCQGWEGPCDRKDARLERQNTQYCDDTYNWRVLCPECQELSDKHWAEMWADYYSDCL